MDFKNGDIFIYKEKEYIYLGEILNKTTDTPMIHYAKNNVEYVREKDDFLFKFKQKKIEDKKEL